MEIDCTPPDLRPEAKFAMENLLPVKTTEKQWVVAASGVVAALGGVSVQRAGWLDRIVHFYKNVFVEDVKRIAAIQIQASLERAPGGYQDSPAWDYRSVARLLALLGASEGAAPLRLALRRALRPSRPTRRFISKQDSWKLFPSLGRDHPNEIYYDFNNYDYDESAEVSNNEQGGIVNDDEAVVVLRNPVEARLPSARISVKLLRDILEARALAARVMPSTTRSTIPWVPMNKTGSNASEAAGGEGEASTAGADGGDVTGGEEGGEGGATAATDAGAGDATKSPADTGVDEPAEGGTENPEKPEGEEKPDENPPPGLRKGKKRAHRSVHKRPKPGQH